MKKFLRKTLSVVLSFAIAVSVLSGVMLVDVGAQVTASKWGTTITDSSDSRINSALNAISSQSNANSTIQSGKSVKDMIYFLLYQSDYRVYGGKAIPSAHINGGTSTNKFAEETTYGSKITMSTIRQGCYWFSGYVSNIIYGKEGSGDSVAANIICTNGNLTEANLKSYIEKNLQAGEHIRMNSNSNSPHSISFVSCDSNGFYYLDYQGVANDSAGFRYTTYAKFTKVVKDYGYKVFVYNANTAINGTTTPDPTPTEVCDHYKLTAPDGFQAVRSSASTTSSEVGRINAGNTVCITKYNSDKSWGYLTYNGISGWIRLYYVEKTGTAHSYGSWTTTKAATCTATGIQTRKCSCGKTETQTIAAKGHSYGNWVTDKAATCTTAGSKSHHCTICGVKTDVTAIPAMGHKYTTCKIAPTYVSKGFDFHLCTTCNQSYKDNYVNAKNMPSCGISTSCSDTSITLNSSTIPFAEGYVISREGGGKTLTIANIKDTNYYTCKITGFNKPRATKDIIIYTESGKVVDTNYWGTEYAVDFNGVIIHKRWYEDSNQLTVPNNGFVLSTHEPSQELSALKVGDKVAFDMDSSTLMVYYANSASSTISFTDKTAEYGVDYKYYIKPYVGNTFGNVVSSSTVSLIHTKHTYGAWTTTKAATCTATGTKTRTCTKCGAKETATIAKTAHTYSTSWTIDKAATCTATGSKSHHCTKCGVKADVTVIPAAGHKYTATVIKPTYTAQGYTLHKCSVCGASYKDNYTAKLTLPGVSGLVLGGRAADALRLNWTKNASAGGYIIEQYTDGKWVRIARIAGNSTTTYRIAGLKGSTAYKFRMKAYKMDGSTALYSGYTELSATTNPYAVSGLKIGGKAKTALRLNWNKNTSAGGYIAEMYSGGKWVRIARISGNSTLTYRKAGLKANTTYKFRVRAYYMVGKTALYGNYAYVNGTTLK